MIDRDEQLKHTADQRRRAEAMLREKKLCSEDLAALPPEEIFETFHQLRVHQIELEMQNEELRRTQGQLEAMKERYFDLYDLAPVGYITLSAKGMIGEANLTAAKLLGVCRGHLAKLPFSRFIFKDDQDAYYRHRARNSDNGGPDMLESRLVREDGTIFWGQLVFMAVPQADGTPVCRITVTDINEKKEIEEALRQSERLRNQAQAAANTLLREQADTLASIYYALDSIGLIVCDLEDGDCRIAIFNSGAEKLLGYRREEAVGRSIAMIYPPPNFWKIFRKGSSGYAGASRCSPLT